jgi:dTDP-4-amino-4,6-dideoxy-D-glucose acyltransferase
MSFYSEEELHSMGFASLGCGVKVSRQASLYGISRISIGDYSRIDDFCVLSAGEGGIVIGKYVHIAVMCSLIGNARIEMADFSGLSSRVNVYSSSDDYSGAFMTNPTVPPEFSNVRHGIVKIGRHVIIGAGSVVLPGVSLEEGASVGALSLVKNDCESFGVYIGIPAELVDERQRGLLEMEKKLNNASDKKSKC